jgi:4'-phosphopantetheinyl transferase
MNAACLPRTAAIPLDVDIALCRLDDDSDVALSTAARWLSPDEAQHAARFRHDRDRDRFVRARGFLRRTLARHLDSDPRALALAKGAQGKPFLPGGELAFNLSHSGGLAAVAISTAHEVGIDIERLTPSPPLPDDLSGLIRACFRPDEAAAITAAAAPQRAFLRFWTAKEARMKLTGEGLGLDPRAIALAHENGRPLAYLAPESPAASLHALDLSGAVGTLALSPRTLTCCAKH